MIPIPKTAEAAGFQPTTLLESICANLAQDKTQAQLIWVKLGVIRRRLWGSVNELPNSEGNDPVFCCQADEIQAGLETLADLLSKIEHAVDFLEDHL